MSLLFSIPDYTRHPDTARSWWATNRWSLHHIWLPWRSGESRHRTEPQNARSPQHRAPHGIIYSFVKFGDSVGYHLCSCLPSSSVFTACHDKESSMAFNACLVPFSVQDNSIFNRPDIEPWHNPETYMYFKWMFYR